MESSQLVPTRTPFSPPSNFNASNATAIGKYGESASQVARAADKLILDKTLDATVVKVGKFDSKFVLSVSAEEIVSKLNELLAKELPEGIESLNPQEYTPDATAQRITDSIAGLFPAFREQHADLSDEEAVEEFMRLASSGVQQGYDEAFEILDGLGAFQIDGVKETIEKTLSAIKDKLQNLEEKLRESLGLPVNNTEENTDETDSTTSPNTERNTPNIPLLADDAVETTGSPPEPLLDEPLQQT